MTSDFTDVDAKSVTASMPLLVGITGCPGSGKTFSALELATGMRRVVGGDIGVVDTEAGRSLHYKNLFDFKYIPFKPPFSPERYEAALSYCLSKNMKTVIFDSTSHEHDGEGGVLDQIEEYLQRKGGDNPDAREKYKWAAQIEPKRQRRLFNQAVEQVGNRAILIFLYRASDKSKPGPGGKPLHLGWKAETTSNLPYLMTARFLLLPGSDGCPVLKADTQAEELSIKLPIQFRDLIKPGLKLNRDLGEKLARWAQGTEEAKPTSSELNERNSSDGKFSPNYVPPSAGQEKRKAEEAEVNAAFPRNPALYASPEQAEEITMELRRLKYGRQAAIEFLGTFGGRTPESVPADRAIACLQALIARVDP
jgi:hypothetical protein